MTINQGVLVVGGVSIVLSIITIATGLLKDKLSKNPQRSMLIIVLIALLSLILMVWVVVNYIIPDGIPQNRDELISKAEELYQTKDYIESVKTLEDKSLDTDPIALNNLAYMYERGLGVSKDLKRASELYEKAKNRGEGTAQKNWIVFSMQHPVSYDQIVETIKYGYEIGDEDCIRWIYLLMGEDPEDSTLSINEVWEKFYCSGSDCQNKSIERLTYELEVPWEYYDGLGGQLVRRRYVDDYKKVFTGTFEKKRETGDIEVTPLTTAVGGYIIEESRLYFVDNMETQFIMQ